MNENAEVAELRRALGEIVALSALPAVWGGYRLPQIVDDVAEVLLRAINPDFVYVTLIDNAVSAARARQPGSDLKCIAAAAKRLLASGDSTVSTIPDPLGGKHPLRATVAGGGGESELAIVAAAAAPHFPTELDRFLLAMTANLANTVISRKRIEELVEENVLLRNEIDERLFMGSVIGASRAMRDVLSDVDRVAPTEANVLITGETGTGKELIAREIHRRSRRAQGPMIAVNAAALPASLIASELFGHERGAFTGATQRRIGRFELASNGTIFLDEISELPPEMQVLLLRVLQERTFERVGGTQTLRTNARVIAATNRDLPKLVAEGTFRGDLYYRLSVFPLRLPPLRERPEDIAPLARHFAAVFAKRLGKQITEISSAGLETLRAYAWPGNVRELENVVERAVILARGEKLVIPAAFFPKHVSKPGAASLPLAVGELEKSAIEKALAASGGRVGGALGAAARLGLRPTTLYSKLRKHHIDPGHFKRPR